MLDEIIVKKAAQHNLKRIDARLPRNKFIVVTGPSGSGKSSLAFDTLFAEGQRRYIECMSAYARQYMDMMEKPEVESIEGLSPAISIDQKTISSNPRSTVGTVTEMYDLLRLLFARVGTPHCPSCGRAVSSQSTDQIVTRILDSAKGRIRILAPVIKGRKGEYHRLFDRLRKKGFVRLRLDGVFRDLEEEIILAKTRSHTGEVQVDDLRPTVANRARLEEAVEKSIDLAEGEVLVLAEDGKETYFSRRLRCPVCDVSLPDLEPRNFSFNSPYGACPRCHGLGADSTTNEEGEVELTGDICPACHGARLNPQSLAVRINGHNIHALSRLSIDRLIAEIGRLEVLVSREAIAGKIGKELTGRLGVCAELGLGYLSLDRTTATLSGGEAQRVRLAAQVGARLRGILYVLDEPTIGLHQRDNGRLIGLLRRIRDDGNTVLVVEHDEQTIRSSDFILDLGPGAGEHGGYVVAEGPLSEILKSPDSLTAKYLRGEATVPVPGKAENGQGQACHPQCPRTQSQEHRRYHPPGLHDGGDRSIGIGKEHPGLRHPLSGPSRTPWPRPIFGPGPTIKSKASSTWTRSSRWTRSRSAGHPGPIRRPTPGFSPTSGSFSPTPRNPAPAATARADSALTSPEAVARIVRGPE